ncbi:polysaccharide lyase family 7 protein [Paenibacillus hamazuiensis]|uniref:polysaccharide lyase family 7 protein n=1 Tax=Paenibacillus hamazuiensis TaxID=2936508 RepID=UPI00200D2541|nr:polysaccharide lyase family 7 protein [Paenibacillus hamazuiensis]
MKLEFRWIPALLLLPLLFAAAGCSREPDAAVKQAASPPGKPAASSGAAAPAPAAVTAGLDPGKPPGSNFDLTHWKLTLPDADSTDIPPASLSQGYTSDYFYTDKQDGAMTFWSPVTGGKTANTDYPRSELRELIDPSSTKVNWIWQGTHVLNAREMVTQVPSSGKVVVMQIHGITPSGGNANPLVKVVYDDKKKAIDCYVKSSVKPGDKDVHYVFPGYGRNAAFEGQLKVTDGLLAMTFGGETKTAPFAEQDPGWKELKFYFKAGVYVQDNEGSADEGGRVKIYKLDASHS